MICHDLKSARRYQNTHLVLVFMYSCDGSNNTSSKQICHHKYRDHTQIVVEDCPAEMKVIVAHKKTTKGESH